MTRSVWLGLVLIVSVACLVVFISVRSVQNESKVPLNVPLLPATDENLNHGYVGWQVCAECHSHRVEEFQKTRHFQAIQLADEVEYPQGFRPGTNVFEPQGSSVRFEMTAQDRGATISTVRLDANPSSTASSKVEFAYGVGAGTDQVFFTRRGDRLFELPTVWLDHQQCWGASSFDHHAEGDLARPLTPQCLECHNTWIDYHRGTLNEYGRFEPQLLRVTCERCHGPAQSHVEYHRLHPGKKTAVSIIQPKQLTRDRQMDLCAQCHTNTVRYRRPPFSYRAGEKLDDSFRILEMRYPEEDRVANQTRYLKESRCYQQSETLTCVTCHDPHRPRPANDPGDANRACFKCHQSSQCGAQSRLPDEVRDGCVSCHMPKRNKVQVNFSTTNETAVFPAPRYEHRIGVYPEAEWEVLYQFRGTRADDSAKSEYNQLGALLAGHWRSVAESATREHRLLVAIDASRNVLRFIESEEDRSRLEVLSNQYQKSIILWSEGAWLKRQGRLDEAIAQFELLREIQPEMSKAVYELGTLYAAKGRMDDAVKSLNQAIEYDVNDPGPHVMLGWMDYLAGHPEKAYAHYLRAQEVDPWSAKIEFMLGQCLVRMDRWPDAEVAFERSLEIDPKYPEACHAMRQLVGSRAQFSAEEALPFARRAVELTRFQRPELLLALAQIYRELRQYPEAGKVLKIARQIAESHETNLIPQIQSEEKVLEYNRKKRRG